MDYIKRGKSECKITVNVVVSDHEEQVFFHRTIKRKAPHSIFFVNGEPFLGLNDLFLINFHRKTLLRKICAKSLTVFEIRFG